MNELVQRSPEWFKARLGKVTSSRIVDVMARLKDGRPGATRTNYLAELVTERLSGTPYPHFQSAAMRYGSEQEAEAKIAYEFLKLDGDEIVPVGFVPHPTIPNSGASPDGYVSTDGLAEFKCPNTSTHMATLRGGSIDKEYMLQMQWQLDCSKRTWCHFCSYDCRFPPEMRLHVRLVARDETMIDAIRAEVTKFLGEVDIIVADLAANYNMKEVPA